MSSRQGWAANLIENSGAATGSWFIFPGGICGFTFQGTVTDVDVEIESLATGSTVAIPVSSLTTVAAAGYISEALPPCRVRVVVTTGTAVYVRATKVI